MKPPSLRDVTRQLGPLRYKVLRECAPAAGRRRDYDEAISHGRQYTRAVFWLVFNGYLSISVRRELSLTPQARRLIAAWRDAQVTQADLDRAHFNHVRKAGR